MAVTQKNINQTIKINKRMKSVRLPFKEKDDNITLSVERKRFLNERGHVTVTENVDQQTK